MRKDGAEGPHLTKEIPNMKVILLGRKTAGGKEPDTLYLFPAIRTMERNGVSIRLAPLPYKFLLVLVVRQGYVVSLEEIHHWLYGHDAEGGPLTDAIKTYLVSVRDAALCLGLDITSLYARGFFVEEFPKGRLKIREMGGRGELE